MKRYPFQLMAPTINGDKTWISFVVFARFYNSIYLGIEEIEVNDTPATNVALVADWLELYKRAKERGEQYFTQTEDKQAIA